MRLCGFCHKNKIEGKDSRAFVWCDDCAKVLSTAEESKRDNKELLDRLGQES